MEHAIDSPLRRRPDCSMEQWQGLYCSRYQKFFCAGKGRCDTMEDYMSEFARFKQSRGPP